MLGAIIGDIAGSSYEAEEMIAKKNKSRVPYEERIKVLDSKTPLFNKKSSYTDDSVLTCAIADALLNDKDYKKYLKFYAKRELNLGIDTYGRSRFGKGFVNWVLGDYDGVSFGNGSAMRVSPVAYYFNNMDDMLENARLATIPSHNSPEAISSAQAVAGSILLARQGFSKREIKKFAEQRFGFDIDFVLDDLSRNYEFTSKSTNSAPQAIYAFLVSENFEDCLRKSISIGGDTDTIACMACSIAEAYYGIPENIKKEAQQYIPDYISKVVNNFYKEVENNFYKEVENNF